MSDPLELGGHEVPVSTDCRMDPDTFIVSGSHGAVYTGHPDDSRTCTKDEPCDAHEKSEIRAVGAGVFLAPVGAEPTDTSSWSQIGYADPDSLRWDDDSGEPVKEWGPPGIQDFKIDLLGSPASAIKDLFGDEGDRPAMSMTMQFMLEERAALTILAPRTRMRPFTDLEREGEWATRHVRQGLAAAFPWLGMDPGPDPDDVWTDELHKVELLPFPITTEWSIP